METENYNSENSDKEDNSVESEDEAVIEEIQQEEKPIEKLSSSFIVSSPTPKTEKRRSLNVTTGEKNPSKDQKYNNELVAVATVTTRMRQFWIDMVKKEKEREEVERTRTSSPKLGASPHRATMGDIPIGKLKTNINIPLRDKKDDIHFAKSVDNGRKTQSHIGLVKPMLSPQPQRKKSHNRSSSNGINEIDPKEAAEKALESRGFKPKEESKREFRRSISFGAKKLYTVKEHGINRMTWDKIQNLLEKVDNLADTGFVEPTKGFTLEIGSKAALSKSKFELEDVEKYSPTYRDYFFGKNHINYVGVTKENKKDYVLISISEQEEVENDKAFFRAIIRTVKEDKRVDIFREAIAKTNHKALLKELKVAFSYLARAKLTLVEDKELSNELLEFERKHVMQGVKVGILLRKQGQNTEEEMFSNEPSEALMEFLKFLGDIVNLKDFTGFRGGLDVKTNTTGEQSVFTNFKNVPVMFHVAPFLPYSSADVQQVERKRHLGNDIVVIIFNEGKDGFSPCSITSEFNHVYVLVQPIENDKYRVFFANKGGVPPYGPLLPSPPIFEKSETFRNFLFTKILNAERAATDAPAFASKITRTRRALMEDIAKKYLK